MSDKTVYVKIGQLIRECRESKGITQTQLARMLELESPQFISLIERGISKVPVETIGKLGVLLDLPTEKIKELLLDDYLEELNTRIKLGKKQIAKVI